MIKKQKVLVVGNWKANPDTLKLAKDNLTAVKKISARNKNVDIVICPPVIFLESLKSNSRPITLGAQDIFTEPSGPFTGYIGYEALRDTKVKYAIIGHSERRESGESDGDINRKIKTALSIGITPIVCVGEKHRDANLEYLSYLKTQLHSAFKEVAKSSVQKIVIAYEPIWAIGKHAKRDAKPSEIEEMVIFIRRVIGDIYHTKSVPPIRIIYGGSVSPNNVADIYISSHVDGFLVGRASLTPKIFGEIIDKVSKL